MASVNDMIHRFRSNPPTSRRERDLARHNGTAPKRMWYDTEDLRPRFSAAGASLRQKDELDYHKESLGHDERSILELAGSVSSMQLLRCSGKECIDLKPSFRFRAPMKGTNKASKKSWGDLEDDEKSSNSESDEAIDNLPYTISQVGTDLDNSLYTFYQTYAMSDPQEAAKESVGEQN